MKNDDLTLGYATEQCEVASTRVATFLSDKKYDFSMPGISKEEARGTNSQDRSFIDKLIRREHLQE